METVFFNGNIVPKEEVRISPDDRGFMFGDGIYEVVRWYKGAFYDMPGHITRMKRSLRELRINWNEDDSFPTVAEELVKLNNLVNKPAMVYLQVTRGAAPRTHSFPSPPVTPTVYASARGFTPDVQSKESGIKVMISDDIRWSRCDIKSVALLANTISFQKAHEAGLKECIFVRNGLITEGSRSNIFFVIDGSLYTHPESNYILSGITRKSIIRIAKKSRIKIMEEAVPENRLRSVQEAFITNTSAEVTPIIEIGGNSIGEGIPGPVTRIIQKEFDAETETLKA
jgi:D-alanine transaminase